MVLKNSNSISFQVNFFVKKIEEMSYVRQAKVLPWWKIILEINLLIRREI